MRQSVNLFSVEFMPKKIWLSFDHSAFFLFLFLIFLLGYYLTMYQDLSILEKENERLLSVYGDENIESSEDSLIDKMMSKKNHLELQISNLSRDVRKKKRIKNVYENNGSASSASFYDVFSNISKYSDRDISISEIAIYDGGEELIINGIAKKKEKIPDYLGQLKEESALKMTEFGLLVINRMKGSRYYQFEMLREVDND